MAPRLIPREGIFTPDFALSIFQSTALNPVLTGSLLAALKQLPRDIVVQLSQKLRVDLLSPSTLKVLKYLLIFGAARQASKALSSTIVNNWESTSWNWNKEVAVVTGGAGGIGYHVAVGLATYGVTVAVIDVQEPKTPFPHPNIHFYKGDVTSATSISDFADAIRKADGNPSILFNNAGIGGSGTIIDKPEMIIREVFDVNIISHFLMVKEFVPSMIAANHGHIISTASMASYVAIGGMVDYASTKAALMAFHEGLAQELKHYHHAPKVRTTIVHPSWTKTPLTKPLTDAGNKFRPSFMEVETVSDAIVAQIVSGKSGKLILPPTATVSALLRAYPGWLQETIRNLATKMLQVVSPKAETRLEK